MILLKSEDYELYMDDSRDSLRSTSGTWMIIDYSLMSTSGIWMTIGKV